MRPVQAREKGYAYCAADAPEKAVAERLVSKLVGRLAGWLIGCAEDGTVAMSVRN